MRDGRGDIVKKLQTTAAILAGAALAAVAALAALVAYSQPDPAERPGLISVGNVTTSLGDVGVLAEETEAGGEHAPSDDGYLPVASIRSGAASSDGSAEGRSGGSSSHNWSLRGSVVEVVAGSSCVVMATDDEGAGVLEPGLVTVFIDWSQPALPSVSEISVGASYEVRYMLPLLEPGYVAADTIEPL